MRKNIGGSSFMLSSRKTEIKININLPNHPGPYLRSNEPKKKHLAKFGKTNKIMAKDNLT
jgi:hypothetical protein